MKIIIFTILLSAYINVAFTQPTTPTKAKTQSIESIKVPNFADAEVRNFFTSYQNNLINYLSVVRQNNKPAIKAAFDKDVSNFDKIVKMLEKARANGPAEHRKLLDYLTQTKPFIKEISQHPYVKELSAAYLKTYNKK